MTTSTPPTKAIQFPEWSQQISEQSLLTQDTPGNRLRTYREGHLGFSLAQMEAHYGIGGTTFNYSETQGKVVSSRILEALTRVPPPKGKQRVNIHWLTMNSDQMLLPADKIQVVTDPQALESAVQEAEHQYNASAHGPTAIFPAEVAQAAQLVDTVLEAMPPDSRPTGLPKWEAIATAAELLARDRQEKREGTARRFLLGLKQEWEARQKAGEAAPAVPNPPAAR